MDKICKSPHSVVVQRISESGFETVSIHVTFQVYKPLCVKYFTAMTPLPCHERNPRAHKPPTEVVYSNK